MSNSQRIAGRDFVYMQLHADGEPVPNSEIVEVDATPEAITQANVKGLKQVNTPPPAKPTLKKEEHN